MWSSASTASAKTPRARDVRGHHRRRPEETSSTDVQRAAATARKRPPFRCFGDCLGGRGPLWSNDIYELRKSHHTPPPPPPPPSPWQRAQSPTQQVEIYHSKQRLVAFAKTASEVQLHNEQEKINRLEHAVRLSPGEIKTCPDQAYEAAVASIAACPEMAGEWPAEVASALARRQCVKLVADPLALYHHVWPCSLAGQTVSQTEWDPLQPSVHGLPNTSMQDKVDLAVSILLEDFLANRMIAQERGMEDIVAMAGAVAGGVEQLPKDLGDKTIKQLTAVADLLLGTAAVVQATPTTQAQLRALTELETEKSDLASVVRTLWQNPWWQAKREKAWVVVADEAMSQPQIHMILEGLSTPEKEARAWNLAQQKLQQWQVRLRPRATHALEHALVQHALQTAEEAARGEATKAGLRRAEGIRVRLSWLSAHCPHAEAELREATDTLTKTIKAQASQLELSAGVALVTTARQKVAASEPIPEEMIAEMSAAFKDCTGLVPPEGIRADMEALVGHFAAAGNLTSTMCQLCLRLLALLGATESPQARQWAKADIGLKLVALALGTLGGDPAGPCGLAGNTPTELLAQWKELALVATLPGAAGIEEAAAQVEGQHRKACEDQVREATAALASTVKALEKAGGGSLTGHGSSWKDGLGDKAGWADVLREAQYHLTSTPGAEARLTPLVEAVTKAWSAHAAALARLAASQAEPTAASAQAEELEAKKDRAVQTARATACEAFFVTTLESLPPGQAKRKALQGRIESMSRKGVESVAIHPLIWSRVMTAITGKPGSS